VIEPEPGLSSGTSVIPRSVSDQPGYQIPTDPNKLLNPAVISAYRSNSPRRSPIVVKKSRLISHMYTRGVLALF